MTLRCGVCIWVAAVLFFENCLSRISAFRKGVNENGVNENGVKDLKHRLFCASLTSEIAK